jgi:hypothetical protein
MVNDAFYFFASSPGNPISPQLNDHGSFVPLSFGGSTCFPSGQPLSNYLGFIEGVGQVTPGTVPEYNPGHTYRFVVDFGSASGHFTVGDEDCGFYDNTGAFTLSINGVELAPPDFDTDDDGVPDADEPCFCLQASLNQVVTSKSCFIQQFCPGDAPGVEKSCGVYGVRARRHGGTCGR